METEAPEDRSWVMWRTVYLARGNQEGKAGFRRWSISVGRGHTVSKAGDVEKPHKYLPFLIQRSHQEGPFSPWRGLANRTGYIKKPKINQVEWLLSVQEHLPDTGECFVWTPVSRPAQGLCLHTHRLSFPSLSRIPGCGAGRQVLGLCVSGRCSRPCAFWPPGMGGNAHQSQGWERGRNTGEVGGGV